MAFAVASPARVVSAPRRGAVVVRAAAAGPDRRSVLGAGLAAVAATLAAATGAQAITIPSQESTGSTVRRGSIPPSSTSATMSGYVMEGTKKRGLSPAQKKKKLAKAKEAILANDR